MEQMYDNFPKRANSATGSDFAAEQKSELSQGTGLDGVDVAADLVLGNVFEGNHDAGVKDVTELVVQTGAKVLHLG